MIRGNPCWFARALLFIFAGWMAARSSAASLDDRWWPIQKVPKTVFRIANNAITPELRAATDMLLQSIAGLGALSVNRRVGDELVWVDIGHPDLDDWFARWLGSHPAVTSKPAVKPWELVDHFTKSGVIKGYILYRADKSKGELNAHRPGLDASVNVATSLAGLLGGILIEESLQKEAETHGLKLLLDARDKDQAWCFRNYLSQFNRRLICTQDPKKPHTRDLAIAQLAFTVYGNEPLLTNVLTWLEPLSPILGWNGGDEFQTTALSTSYGHIQTATDWCMNLPVLMAGSEDFQPVSAPAPVIDWSDERNGVALVSTDGDNVQWLQGNFFRSSEARHYWADPARGEIPYGWSCCFSQLAQLCPQAIDYATSTRSTNDFFIEWGGGYYYPDLFASKRTNRYELLAAHATRTWSLMQKTGTRIIGFNCTKYSSAETRKALQIFASQTDSLLAIFVFQYEAYEAGAGGTFWVLDRKGVEVPVISARYSIWEHANTRQRTGTPAKIAREVLETVEKSKVPRYDWAIDHVWSYFKKAPGVDENAENVPQQNGPNVARGYTPAIWCAERLAAKNIRLISPDELALRVRMRRNPEVTRAYLEAWSR